ncbi:hypothetical protein [Paenibacillus sp. YIM B09110]|uniref:hypothetical protein n=1 Tax=Paenibacillus sp. YIM B09110 TaxID=3126102 RepID=UPI00301C627D
MTAMCTTGAIVINGNDGKRRVFGFKTSDSPWTGFWHGQLNRPGGFDSLAYGLVPQQGVNAGMNRAGLTLISSYFDYVENGHDAQTPSESSPAPAVMGNPHWGGDLRGIVQAEALSKCADAPGARQMFEQAFGDVIAPVGGNHVIADASGFIYVFEHCRGKVALQDASDTGYVARSNQSFLLFQEEQGRMAETTRKDREQRLEQAEGVLAELKRDEGDITSAEVIDRLKLLVSMHRGAGDEPGSICAHGLVKGRSNAAEPHETMSGLLWDITGRTMYYTIGHPCRSEWKELRFT